MSRLCPKQPSVRTDQPLEREEIYQKLVSLRQIVSSCYGPCGRLKQIHNNVGGHVLTTSTSSVLFKGIQVSQPLLKLIRNGILDHTARLSDCGLFAALLCLSLIDNAKKLDVRPYVAIKVYAHVLEECTRYLTGEHCRCKVQIDFSSCQSLLTLANTVITSKPACMLTAKEAQHLTSLTVQAFLQAIPCDTPGTVCLGRTVIVPIDGQPVEDSAIFPGLLVDMPEMLLPADLDRLKPGPHKLVLFSASLSGDLSEFGETTLVIHAGVNPEAVLLERLLKLGEQMVRDGVVVLACQRVVHPVLQHHLRERGMVVIERLGLANMEPIIQMTGAQEVASLQAPVSEQAYGRVSGLRPRRAGSRKLLQLLPCGERGVCSMLLCHRNETALDELKVTCQKAEHVLRLALKEPCALLGGGCTETILSAHLKHTSQGAGPDVASSLGCSQAELLLGVQAFCAALGATALALQPDDHQDCLLDLTHAHHWLWPADAEPGPASPPRACGCGLVEGQAGMEWTHVNTAHQLFLPCAVGNAARQPRLLDSFSAKLSALGVAVERACLILDVQCIIRDVN